MAAAVTGARASAVDRLAPEPATDAARDLYERHGAAILRFCRSRLRSREEAEDARQTTFLHALRALGRGVVPAAELSWLLKIAENVCKTRRQDARRRFAFEVTEDPAELGRIAAPARPDVELLMPLGDALDRLTAPQRQALLLREWQGLSYKEIAAELGIGQGAVEVLLFRARRALAEELETPGKVRRRRVRALDLGWLAGLAKQFLGGGIAAKATLAAIAAGVAAAVSTVAVAVGSDAPRPAEPSRPDHSPPAAPAGRDHDVRRAAPASPAPDGRPERTRRGETEVRSVPLVRAEEARPVPEPVHARPAGEPAGEAPSPAPRPATVDEVAGTVSSVVEPVVGTVESTAEPVVGALEDVVEDVLETAESAVPSVAPEPALPEIPELP